MAPSCWFFCALWLPLMLAVAAADEQVEACVAKKCGNLTISDPFWLADKETGRSCGSSDFEVDCVNGGSVLWSSMPSSDGFTIVDISYEEKSLHVVDGAKLYTSDRCGVLIMNTSAKLSVRFKIDPANMNLVLYNCTEKGAAVAVARRDRYLVETGVRCGNESRAFARAGVRSDPTENYSGYALEGCDAIVVPVLGSSAGKKSASKYEQLIRDGFLLTWVRPPYLCTEQWNTKIKDCWWNNRRILGCPTHGVLPLFRLQTQEEETSYSFKGVHAKWVFNDVIQ